MTDSLNDRLRQAAPTPSQVDVADLRRRADRPSDGRVAGWLGALMLVVATVALLARPAPTADVGLGPNADLPAPALTQAPEGPTQLPSTLAGVDASQLRLALERDEVAIYVGPPSNSSEDVCLYLVVGDAAAGGCQRLDPPPLTAQVRFAEPSREVIAALVADGYDQAELADERVVPIDNNVLLVSGPPPMIQGVTLRGPAGEATVNLGARNPGEGAAAETPPADAVARIADVCGPDPVAGPGAQAPATSKLSAVRVDVKTGTPVAQPASAEGLPSVGPPPAWWEWLRSQQIFRFPDADLDLARVDGPRQGLCATLQSAASDPSARTVAIGDTTGLIVNDRILLWLAADELMLQLAGRDPIADDALIDIAGRIELRGPRDLFGDLPSDLGLAIRGDGRLDILTTGTQTTYTDDSPIDDNAFAPGDEPDSLALIDDMLISYGGDTYALMPGTDQPQQIGRSTYFLPAPDRDAVWLLNGALSTSATITATLIDADGTVLTGPHTLPEGNVVQQAIGEGLLLSGAGRSFWIPDEGARPIDVGEIPLAAHGDRFATCQNFCSQLNVYTTPDNLIAAPGGEQRYIGYAGAFSADGQQLAVLTRTPGADVDVLIVDLERADSYPINLDFADVRQVGFGPEGELVIAGDREIVIINGQRSVTVALPSDIPFVKDLVVMNADLAHAFHRTTD